MNKQMKRCILIVWCSLAGAALSGQTNQTAAVDVFKRPATTTNRVAQPAKPAPKKKFIVSPDQIAVVSEKVDELSNAIAALREAKIDDVLLADVEVFHRAGAMLLRFTNEEFFEARFVTDALKVLDTGLARSRDLAEGRAPWTNRAGQVVRGYRSKLDGTVQPYALIIPAAYKGRPSRLDVILHGRGATLSEVNFIVSRETTNAAPTNVDYIRLEVYGRWNNAYRFAGETDVFEAMASVQSRYTIDASKIVLRGFSMGGGGAWHLGMHHPDRWAALESGAGFTETIRFTKVSNLTATETAVLPVLDADSAARNALNLPVVGYGGEDDKQLQASINMREALEQLGVHFTQDGLNWSTTEYPIIFLVGPKTGHKWHPDSKAQSDAFIDAALAKPRTVPDRIRFVTYTTRYNHCFWFRVDALTQHYLRAEVDAVRKDGGKSVAVTVTNVEYFTLEMPPPDNVSINGVTIKVPKMPANVNAAFARTSKGWALATVPIMSTNGALRKIHGLQGPIDDAFMESFLCVKPTGTPDNPIAQDKALALLDRFSFMYAKWLRGDVRVKNDTDISADDIAKNNLVVFGDPAGNKFLARVADKLPVRWSKDTITMGSNRYTAKDNLPVFIYPNPLNPKKYIVVNTGHTIPEKDWRGNNALQFAKLGDWAVLKVEEEPRKATNDTVVASGFFDERWGVRE
ncbi:MAG: prolyl oligopeptidase family serine peptidase [Spirochaetes bacterium]|nr:prolyl oligopeptidase family serine peptidase [Spirochaetota bacterium]